MTDTKDAKETSNLLQNLSGYHQLQTVSGSFDNDDDLKEIRDIIEAQQVILNGSNLLQTDEDYLTSDTDTPNIKSTQRRLILLQNINVSLKHTIDQQMKQIEILKDENKSIKLEMEKYKSIMNKWDKKKQQTINK